MENIISLLLSEGMDLRGSAHNNSMEISGPSEPAGISRRSHSCFRKKKRFSDLRIRASYGSNGNQSIDDFASRGLYSNTASYDNNPGFVLSQYGNDQLTWEKNKPFNVGMDFGLLSNRIQGSLEYYVRTTSGLLLNRPVSATNGVTSVTQNIGSMQNSGIELELNTTNVAG